MRFLFFLGPSARGLRPQAVGERTFSPVTTTTSRQGRGHNVCFDLTAAPAGDFSLAFDGGLTLAYADADRTCCLTFTDDAMPGGRTSRYVKPDAPCRRPHGAARLCPSRIFLHGTCIFCQMSLFDEMIAKIL
jgi:hypothetical protein